MFSIHPEGKEHGIKNYTGPHVLLLENCVLGWTNLKCQNFFSNQINLHNHVLHIIANSARNSFILQKFFHKI